MRSPRPTAFMVIDEEAVSPVSREEREPEVASVASREPEAILPSRQVAGRSTQAARQCLPCSSTGGPGKKLA